MKSRLTMADFNDSIYQNDCQKEPSFQEQGIFEQTIHGNYCFGKAELREMQFDNFFIAYGDLHLFKDTTMYLNDESSFVGMHFALRGNSQYYLNKQRFSGTWSVNEHNIIYSPHLKGNIDICKGRFKKFEVGISTSLFERLAANGNILLSAMLKSIRQERPSMLGNYNRPITQQIGFIIHEILSCNRTGYLKRLFLEAKIIELFMLQLEQFEGPTKKVRCTLNMQDVEKIHAVKDLLRQKIDGKWSILELSRSVGINDFKLKKGFREIFGTTVFGYLNDLKMERAKAMLLQQAISINEVSRLTGFKNQTHFTAAFKKKFGLLPSTIGKRNTL